jgi:hypothetical protein
LFAAVYLTTPVNVMVPVAAPVVALSTVKLVPGLLAVTSHAPLYPVGVAPEITTGTPTGTAVVVLYVTLPVEGEPAVTAVIVPPAAAPVVTVLAVAVAVVRVGVPVVAFVTVKLVAEAVAIATLVRLYPAILEPTVVTSMPATKLLSQVYVTVVPLPEILVILRILGSVPVPPPPPPPIQTA